MIIDVSLKKKIAKEKQDKNSLNVAKKRKIYL